MPERHDSSYRLLFSHRRMVRDLVLGFFPQTWGRGLDPDSLEKRSEVRISDRLDRREQDLVWRLRSREEPGWLYLLIELQSSPDPHIALRLRVYRDLLYQDLIRSGEVSGPRKFPPVMPTVLYNGKQGGSPPRDLEGLWLDMLRGPLPEGDNLVALLCRLERSRSLEEVGRWIGRLTQAAMDVELRRAFTAFLRRSLLPARFPGAEIPALEDLEEIRPMLRETVIEWTQQWLAEGRAEGKAEGKAEGRRQGGSELLLRQLHRKFGRVPVTARERIESAEPERLLEWGERLLFARSLSEVFGD